VKQAAVKPTSEVTAVAAKMIEVTLSRTQRFFDVFIEHEFLNEHRG
jgi:hypothetical protein